MSGAAHVGRLLAAAGRVVIVPGYGLAVAQAHHALARLVETLHRSASEAGVDVTIAVHPVVGRVPGHLDGLLDAAGVPWACRRSLETAVFDADTVALIVGANDVVNPALPMPVFEVEAAGAVAVFLDTTAPGYAGVPNPLFDRVPVLLGDAGDLVREAEQAVARVAQAGNDVADVVEPLVESGDHHRH